jgi:hypothetical protein
MQNFTLVDNTQSETLGNAKCKRSIVLDNAKMYKHIFKQQFPLPSLSLSYRA